ncbi:MAG: hypothetical protein GC203_08615 [Phenylobacterium sp.]|uniref:hypothetical protein n=1 Tax=Phenylobacterium sp. TaxID=1871053 RepID=UPI0025D4AEBD|nr:hypothetical protein [Phenylobacterium sp.]MBI1197912.1 hypothetical protein [Phenylobacterium sp.]
MAMTMFDHDQRLHDLEAILCALVEELSLHPETRALLAAVGRKLRARGARGAAELLEGNRVLAAYRR